MDFRDLRVLLWAALLSGPATSGVALASSSERIETEGGSIRLVSAGRPDADGVLRAALEIQLRPGWKTYWRDPGGAGLPASIDIGDSSQNISGIAIDYPAPVWIDDSYGAWAGYVEPVALPVTLTIAKPSRFALLEAEIMLGVCETICIPVNARLTLDPGDAPDDPHHRIVVEAAHASAPKQPQSDLAVREMWWSSDGTVTLDIAAPSGGGHDTALFLESGRKVSFGMPEKIARSGATQTYRASVSGKGHDQEIAYTLVSGGRSVSGTVMLPPRP